MVQSLISLLYPRACTSRRGDFQDLGSWQTLIEDQGAFRFQRESNGKEVKKQLNLR